MDRLFRDFDFFSVEDRDFSSPHGQNLKKRREQPECVKATADIFGDVKYAFDSDLSDIDSDLEPQPNEGRSRIADYEVFLNGFFYFFLLQDPFIRQYLEISFEPTK